MFIDVCMDICVMMSSDLYGTCVSVLMGLDRVTGLGSGISNHTGLEKMADKHQIPVRWNSFNLQSLGWHFQADQVTVWMLHTSMSKPNITFRKSVLQNVLFYNNRVSSIPIFSYFQRKFLFVLFFQGKFLFGYFFSNLVLHNLLSLLFHMKTFPGSRISRWRRRLRCEHFLAKTYAKTSPTGSASVKIFLTSLHLALKYFLPTL